MKHLKLFEELTPHEENWDEENWDEENWDEEDFIENDDTKAWEIRYYEVPVDASMFATPEYEKSEYVEGTKEQVNKYILSKTYKKYKWEMRNGIQHRTNEYDIEPVYKKKKSFGYDYISLNGAIKLKEIIKIKKL